MRFIGILGVIVGLEGQAFGVTFNVQSTASQVKIQLVGSHGHTSLSGGISLVPLSPFVKIAGKTIEVTPPSVDTPAVIRVIVGPGGSDIQSGLVVRCPYCDVKMSQIPAPVTLMGRRLSFNASQIEALSVNANVVRVSEVTGVERFEISAQTLDLDGAVLIAKEAILKSPKGRCTMRRGFVELTKQGLLWCRDVVFQPDVVRRSGQLSFQGQKLVLAISDARIESVVLGVNDVFAWLGMGVRVGSWRGMVTQAKVFSANAQNALIEAVGGGSEQFSSYHVLLGTGGDTRPARFRSSYAVSNTEEPRKTIALKVRRGFFVRLSAQEFQPKPDKERDESLRTQKKQTQKVPDTRL